MIPYTEFTKAINDLDIALKTVEPAEVMATKSGTLIGNWEEISAKGQQSIINRLKESIKDAEKNHA